MSSVTTPFSTEAATEVAIPLSTEELIQLSCAEMLNYFHRLDVELWAEEGQLRFSAPEGALTAERKAALVARKADLLGFLQGIGMASDLPEIERLEGDGPFPASFAQERMAFLHALNRKSSAYNMPVASRLEGTLDREALSAAFRALVDRQAALRTGFEQREGRLMQIVAPASPDLLLPWIDLTALNPEEREAEAERLTARESQRRFDLERCGLWRAFLIQMTDRKHEFFLNLHHIISDGWSMEILRRDLLASYGTLARGDRSNLGDRSTLTALPVRYVDYASWQRQWLQGEVLEQQLDFWRSRLDPPSPVLEWPLDHPRQQDRGIGSHASFQLPSPVSTAIEAFGKRNDATPFMITLAAFQALLARRTGEYDLSVGTPVAGRRLPEVEPLVGLFVNTLVVRVDQGRTGNFRELVGAVRQEALAAFDHQDLPFEKLVEALQPERSAAGRGPGHPPLFQAFFAFQNTPRSRIELPDLSWTTRFAESGTGFDLSFHLEPRADHLRGVFAYRASFFDHTTLLRLGRQFHTLLTAVLEKPERPLAELDLLSPGEVHQLLVEWNDTETAYELAPLPELLRLQADRTADTVALVFADEQLTYDAFSQAAGALAGHLRQLGVDSEDRIGILMERSIWRLIALVAVLEAGAAYVPIDPALPTKRRKLMMEDGLSDPRLLLVESSDGDIEECETRRIRVDRRFSGQHANPVHVHLDQAAYVIYTSGSTGKPKGVLNTHRGLMNRLLWAQQDFGCDAEERWLHKASFSFDISLYEMFTPLLSGARLVLMRAGAQGDPDVLARAIEQHRITFIHFPPAMLRAFLDQSRGGLKSLRRLQTGGDVLPPDLLERCRAALPEVAYFNLYGPTEAAINVSWWRDLDRRILPTSVPIGQPIANCRLHLLDRQLRPLPIGVPGALYLGGVQLARCYHRRTALTAKAFLPDPFSEQPGARLYRSGDLGRYLVNGEIEFLGRTDFQVKLRGFRIELGEIETVLRQESTVREAVVLVDEEASNLVACLATGSDELETGLRDRLQARLESSLPAYMVPRSFVALPILPTNNNGKIDRLALRREMDLQLASREVSSMEGGAPQNATEAALCEIFAEVLRRDGVVRNEDFFELGGHSLLATQVVARVRTRLDRDLPLAEIFATPTVSRLAERLRSARSLPLLDLVKEHRGRQSTGQSTGLSTGLNTEPEPSPLSFAQERLFFLHRLDPESAAYNMPSLLEWRGPLQGEALEAALREVVALHGGLRTVFEERNGSPWQIERSPASSLAWTVLDLTHLDEEGAERAARARLGAEARRPFDLRRGPLTRVVLVRLSSDRAFLLINLHHIVSDGWSMKLLTRQALAHYRARVGGLPAPDFAVPPLSYADYAIAQRQWLQGEVLESQLAFWRERLSNQPPVTEWPLDRPRGAVQSGRGARLRRTLDPCWSEALVRHSRERSATAFMGLCAASAALLARWSGLSKLVLGTPIAGRHHPGVEGVVGLFVNTLALPFDLEGAPSFNALLDRTRAVTLDAYEHQDLPFEKLVEALRPERQLGAQPFFQAMVSLQHQDEERPDLSGVELIHQPFSSGMVKFDLDLSFFSRQDRVNYSLEYSTDLFDRTTASRLTRHLESLIKAAMAEPERPLRDLPWLDKAERHQLLREWTPPEKTVEVDLIPDRIEQHFLERGDSVAIIDGSAHLSFAELDRRSHLLARHLLALGAGSERIFGHLFPRSLESMLTLIAILRTGSAYLPLDPTLPDERLAKMVADAEPLAILSGDGTERLSGDATPVIRLDTLEWNTAQSGRISRSLRGEELAYMLYTSGSTGEPKGVEVSYRAMRSFLTTVRRHLGMDENVRMLQFASLGFDTSVEEIFATLSSGGTLVLRSSEVLSSIDAFLAASERHRLNLIHLPTAFWHEWMAALARRSRPFPSALETVVIGGEQASMAAWRTWFDQPRRPRLVNSYGPTEATVAVTEHSLEAPTAQDGIVPIGRAIEGTSILILGPRLGLLPVGVPGEMFLAGGQLARGYRGRAGETAWRFLPSPFAEGSGKRLYRTGDLARLRGDGGVEVLGRLDHQVKIRGFRIELGEIEATLAEHPAVRFAVVLARQNGGVSLCAYVVKEDVGTEDLAVDRETLRAYLASGLPEYMVPTHWVFLESLPKTATGKIDRRALPEPDRSAQDGVTQPRDQLEFEIARIFGEVLGSEIAEIDVSADFFDLGGHSLLALRLLGRLEERFGRELPLNVLFQHGTVERLAALLSSESASVGSDVLVPLHNPENKAVPLFIVHPIGGEVMAYLDLARRLDRPVFGLVAPTDDTETSLGNMAGRYVEALRKVRPNGPYLLAGWSMGGLIAFEMAKRLESMEPSCVTRVAMIDSWGFESPTGLRERLAAEDPSVLVEAFARDLARSWNLSVDRSDLPKFDPLKLVQSSRNPNATSKDALREIHAWAEARGMLPPGVDLSRIERLFDRFRHHLQAARHYVPSADSVKIAGKTILFRADVWPEKDVCEENRHWRKAAEDFTWVPLPGDHFSLLRPPGVEELAKRLAAWMRPEVDEVGGRAITHGAEEKR